MRILAIIPARGGSKRIERKNVKEFAGKPIISYSIDAALKSGCFDEVMVSTDDQEIASVACQYGASVPFLRSARTSDDYATTADVIREVLDEYAIRGKKFDAIACIYATAPFVTAERICQAAEILREGRAEAAFTCVEYSYPIQRSLRVNGDRVSMRYPEYANARSQDLEKTYHDAGQFYFTTVEAFLKYGSLWGPETAPIIMPELEVQDLDTITDWKLAEMKYELLKKETCPTSSKKTVFPLYIDLGDFICESYTVMNEETSQAMLAGRNDESVRCRMINREPVKSDEHARFVESLKNRHDRAYYAVKNNKGEIAGSFNLTFTSPDTVERGIWISADKRGLGYGHKMMEALYAYLRDHLGVETVTTTVRTDNMASLSLESRLNARETGRDREFIYYKKNL